MATDDDIFQQYRAGGSGGAPSASSPAPAAPAPSTAKTSADDDIFQQYRASPPSSTPPTPQQAEVAARPPGYDDAYGMMAPAFAPGTTGRDFANALVGGIYSAGANLASNIGITPNPLPADVRATMATHPYVAGAGHLFGGVAATAPLLLVAPEAAAFEGIGLGGAGWLPAAARGAITGGGLGAVQNALTGDPQESLVNRALTGAGWGALGGGVLGGVGSKVGDWLASNTLDTTAPAAPFVSGVNPLSPEAAARANVRAATTPPEAAAAGPAPSSPVPSRPAAASVPTTPPATAAEAKQVASAYYDKAATSGGTLTPQFTNKFIDSIEATAPQTAAGRAFAGESELSKLVGRVQALRDQPLTLQAAQEIDEGLSGLIDKEYGIRGLSKDGQQLLDVQRSLRDQIANAGPGDVSDPAGGFDALVQGRKAWSQAMKMDDLERMKARADQTDNPTTSFRTQVRNLTTNRARSRGYSDDEIAALQDAAERGVIGGALHLMGSRLLPHVAGAVGASVGGIPGFFAGEATAHFGGAAARRAANALQARRFGRAMGVLGGSVPPNPLAAP